MADSNKLVSLIVLVIVGILIAIFGGYLIYLFRRDRAALALAIAEGRINAAEAAALANPTWYYILAGILIVIGIVLIIWGIFQYFAKAEDVYHLATSKAQDYLKRGKVIEQTTVPLAATETISISPLGPSIERVGRAPVTRRGAPFSVMQ